MGMRRHTAVVAAAIAGALLLTGCGKSADDLFSNLEGASASNSYDAGASATETPQADAPPNYADNNRVRTPGEMKPQDEKLAGRKAAEIKRVLERLRRSGKISPAEVQSELSKLVAPDTLSVSRPRSVWSGTREGSFYGIWVGDTACITGAVKKERVWADVNGPYPESRCLPPAPTH